MGPLNDEIGMDEDVAKLDQEVFCVAIMKRLNTKALVLVSADEVDNMYLRVGKFSNCSQKRIPQSRRGG